MKAKKQSKPKKAVPISPNLSVEIESYVSRSLPFFNLWDGVCLYHQAPAPLFHIRPQLSPAAAKLYDVLVDYCSTVEKKIETELPARQLVRLAGRGISISHVGDYLRELEKHWLIRTRPSGKHNRSIITICDPLTGEPVRPERGAKIDPNKGLPQFEGDRLGDFVLSGDGDHQLEEEYEPQVSGNGSQYRHRRPRDLREDEIIKYYREATDTTEFKKSGSKYSMASCPFHGDGHDRTPSLSIDRSNGKYFCFGCRGQGIEFHGNIYGFEMRRSDCDYRTAVRKVVRIIGAEDISIPKRASAIKEIPKSDHVYRAPDGTPLSGIWRFPPEEPFDKDGKPSKNTFRAYHIDAAGHKVYGAPEFHARLLYNLDQVVKASTVLILEGEKDCDSVSFLGLLTDDGTPLATTTNPFGANQWVYHYSQWLRGKRVLIMGDCDVSGVDHVQKVYQSVKKFASDIQVVKLPYPILPEHGHDVSDFLAEYCADDLVKLLGPWVKLPDGVATEDQATGSRTDEQPIEI